MPHEYLKSTYVPRSKSIKIKSMVANHSLALILALISDFIISINLQILKRLWNN